LLLLWSAANADAADPPERVGRVSYLDGQVILQTGKRAFEPAVRNWPVIAEDRLVTQRDAHAELGLGTATIWLDEMTDASLIELTPDIAQIEIGSGTVNVRVRGLGPEESIVLRGRTVKMQLRQSGDYQFALPKSGRVTTTVRVGQADVDTGEVIFQQLAGEAATIEPDRTMAIAPSRKLDLFDRWCEERQEISTGALTAKQVAPGLVGFEDLDYYGSWRWEPGYGMAWEPKRVATNWIPYRYGVWTWKEPWGWTWVDDTPWGFAPFHYGRWIHTRSRWLWLPGPRHVTPIYAPALVGWTDDAADRNVIGWFPLGAQEFYSPPYPVSEQHARRLNSFVTTVTRGTRFANGASDNLHGSTTIVWASRSVFAGHPPVRQESRQSTVGREIVR
jgi:hypothetical protein